MIGFLWTHRERPRPLSRRWCVVWGKRVLHAWGLLRYLAKRARHQLRGVRIGRLSIINDLLISGPGRHLVIGDHSFIGSRVRMATHAQITIGSHVCINDGVQVLSASHDVTDPQWRMFSRPIVIGDYAWVAISAIVLPGVTIGRGAVVGAGAVVSKDVPDYAVVAGNPATVLRSRRQEHLNYDPVLFAAPYEAWLGRNAALMKEVSSP